MFLFFIGFLSLCLVIYICNHLLSPKALGLKSGHVVITGGSSGIGRSLAVEVVKQGGNVTIIARKENVLKEAKEEIQKHVKDASEQKVLTVSLDLTGDPVVVEQGIRKAEDQLGPVDMLINCAGFSISDNFEKITMEEFRGLMEVNYFGSVSATKAVVAGMKSRNTGRIVFVSSQAGQVGIFGFTAYSASKFALRGLAEALQMELKPYNVYVTLAFPPDTDTPGYKEEMIRKPRETRLISETSGLFQPDQVARSILRDATCGRFLSHIGLDGFMISILTSGMSPIASIVDGLVQISLMSIFRLVSLFYLSSFDRIVSKCRGQSTSGGGDDNKSKQH